METKPSISSIGLRYGLIVGVIASVYTLILYMAGLGNNTPLGLLGLVILIAGIVMAHNAYKAQGNGFMSIGQGIGIGMILSIVSGIISSLVTYLYVAFIDDSAIRERTDQAMLDMESQGLSDEQIDQAMKYTEMFTSPIMILVWGIVGSIIMGFIISLIISLFTKKTEPQPSI
jgi:hypothetical protein